MEFYDEEEDEDDFENEIYKEKEYDLDLLFNEAQNEKNTESQIEQYENIINLEMSTSIERNFSFQCFEQLTLTYLSLLNKEKFIFNFKKLLELRTQLDPVYSKDTMTKIIVVIQSEFIYDNDIIHSLVSLLHKTLGTGKYYQEFLHFLHNRKIFFTEEVKLLQFPIDIFKNYIPDFFIYNYEVRVVKEDEQTKIIGGKKYTPAYGWTSYEFNIYDKYDNGDNSWLGCDGKEGEWANAYHGTARNKTSNEEIMMAVDSIYKENLKAGSGQQYQSAPNGNPDTKNLYPTCGIGVYVTPDIKVAEAYAGRLCIDGKYYAVVILFKVNPLKLRIPVSKNDYWVCEGSTDGVRPFRLLIKESQKNPYC